MPLTITRGYGFGSTEEVTSSKLHQLVENADIAGIHWSELSGTVISLSSGSPPGNPPGEGWISAVYEPPLLDNSSYSGIWSTYSYLLETAHGPVALFRLNGMETRRLVCSVASASPRRDGTPCFIPTSGGFTLAFQTITGNNTYGSPHLIGIVTQYTANTSPTATTGQPRITMSGYVPVVADSPLGVTGRRWFFQDAHADSTAVGNSSSTSIDKIVGIQMSDMAASGRRPAYFFGKPIWRV